MDYTTARATYEKMPDSDKRKIDGAMIDYIQSTPLFVALRTAKRRNREKRYFVRLIDESLMERGK